jgi:hypothetical protein
MLSEKVVLIVKRDDSVEKFKNFVLMLVSEIVQYERFDSASEVSDIGNDAVA